MPFPHRREHEVFWEPCLARRMFRSCVCMRKALRSRRAEHWGTLTVPLAGEYLAGMDKEPLFPQHLNLAKKTALTDKSLPTGQREIAKPAHTVKSSVPSVNSEKPQLLPIMCAAGPSGSLRGHPDLLWKWKPCQPQAVPVLVLPGAMLCSVRFLFPALEPSISKQCCLVNFVSHPQRSGSAVMWPQLCCDDTLLT